MLGLFCGLGENLYFSSHTHLDGMIMEYRRRVQKSCFFFIYNCYLQLAMQIWKKHCMWLLHSGWVVLLVNVVCSFGSLWNCVYGDIELNCLVHNAWALALASVLLPSQLSISYCRRGFYRCVCTCEDSRGVAFFVCAMTDCYLNFPPCRRVGRELR